MNPYTLTAAFVGLSAYYLLSRKAPARHAWPLYLRVVVAWALGLFWPLLTIWAVGWCIRRIAVAAWLWALGDHNKVRVTVYDQTWANEGELHRRIRLGEPLIEPGSTASFARYDDTGKLV